MALPESVLELESGPKLIQLSKNYLSVKLKTEVIESLKEKVKDNPTLSEAVATLVQWSHYQNIPLGDVIEVSTEALPTKPSDVELTRLVFKCKYQGGQRVFELDLAPQDAAKLASEVKKIAAGAF